MREMAHRLFAAEFSSSNYEVKEGEEKSTVYIVTPLGAKVSRMMIAGVLTEVEENKGENWKMYNAQVVDPTGTFRISAGQYQESAARSLQSIEPPAFVAAVGKARAFTTEEGAVYVSIRVESIAMITQQQRDIWTFETCRETMKRIEACRSASELSPPTVDALLRLGVSKRYAEGAILAFEHYGRADFDAYRGVVVEALRSISGVEDASIPAAETAPVGVEQSGREELTDDEKELLMIIGSLDIPNSRGAQWADVEKMAEEKHITPERLSGAVDGLLDKGMVYEPVLGKMKRI
jgi:hypothetical protein